MKKTLLILLLFLVSNVQAHNPILGDHQVLGNLDVTDNATVGNNLDVTGTGSFGGEISRITLSNGIQLQVVDDETIRLIRVGGDDNDTDIIFDLNFGATGRKGPVFRTTGQHGIFFEERMTQATALPRYDFIDTDGGWSRITANDGKMVFSADVDDEISNSSMPFIVDGDTWVTLQTSAATGKGFTLHANVENFIQNGQPESGSSVWCTTRVSFTSNESANCPDFELIPGLTGVVAGTKLAVNDNATMCVYCDTYPDLN